MIRMLVIVAVAGFFMATVCFGGAAALGGHDILRGDWSWIRDWGGDWGVNNGGNWNNGRYRGDRVDAGGPDATRDIAWTGGSRLTVVVPANVQYTQGPGDKITITGPQGAVDHVVVQDGRIEFDRRMRNTGRLQIVMTSPSVTKFEMVGSQRLNIDAYDQPVLGISIAGSGDATGKGKAGSVNIEIAGSGDVDVGGVASDSAKVQIAGSGDATIAPKSSADVEIAGAGDVKLLTHPEHVNRQIMGSGSITYETPPEAPAPAASPAAKAPPPAKAAPPVKGAKT